VSSLALFGAPRKTSKTSFPFVAATTSTPSSRSIDSTIFRVCASSVASSTLKCAPASFNLGRALFPFVFARARPARPPPPPAFLALASSTASASASASRVAPIASSSRIVARARRRASVASSSARPDDATDAGFRAAPRRAAPRVDRAAASIVARVVCLRMRGARDARSTSRDPARGGLERIFSTTLFRREKAKRGIFADV
jgi:hypothetical protein